MTNTKTPMHTPEPWFVVNDGTESEPMMSIKAARISGQPPRHEVALCATGDSPQEMENANARRIVACVNACKGTETEVLEFIKEGGITKALEKADETEAKLRAELNLANEQREALLAASKEALTILREYIEDVGPCDHSVNICACGVLAVAEQLSEAINGNPR